MEEHHKIESLHQWIPVEKRPVLIAGPCSAENEKQVLDTALQLKQLNIPVYRAGIWKPRTRPGGFEGVGKKGLPWLQMVKKETGMLVATEVGNAKHVFEALKYGIDILWIGARTTVNPFLVQEIADALEGTNIPVMVKNPVNPDTELWIGAIERFLSVGITKICAIHRGFSSYVKTQYRNAPLWEIPIEMKRRMPRLPVVCDPSHLGGLPAYIQPLSQRAVDLSFDGLMIETHCNPEVALSDKKQQITPEYLGKIMENLIIRYPETENQEFKILMDNLREKIDFLDDALLSIIENRMNIVRTIGESKKINNVTIFQTERYNKMIERTLQKGENKGMNPEFLIGLFQSIHQESISLQNDIMNKTTKIFSEN